MDPEELKGLMEERLTKLEVDKTACDYLTRQRIWDREFREAFNIRLETGAERKKKGSKVRRSNSPFY